MRLPFAGVPGEDKQPTPTPDVVEVEVGHTAYLNCGPPRHSSVNLTHVDWFLVSAWASEGCSRWETLSLG